MNQLVSLGGLALVLSGLVTPGFSQSVSSSSESGSLSIQAAQNELKRWSSNYFNYMNGPTMEEAKGTSINHYLELGRKVINDDWYLGAVGRFDSEWGTGQEDAKVNKVADHFVKVGVPAFYKGSEGGRIRTQLRYHLPTSDASKEKEQTSIIEPRLYLEKDFGETVSLKSILIPQIYTYKKEVAGQRTAKLGNYFQGSYNFGKLLSLDLGVYPSWTYVREGERTFNELPIYPGATINFSEKVSLSPYMEIFATKVEKKTTSYGGSLSVTML